MMRLTRKEVKFEWNDLCERAFHELKRRLASAPILIVLERGHRYTPTRCIGMPRMMDLDVY